MEAKMATYPGWGLVLIMTAQGLIYPTREYIEFYILGYTCSVYAPRHVILLHDHIWRHQPEEPVTSV